jgi:hypothetical protein
MILFSGKVPIPQDGWKTTTVCVFRIPCSLGFPIAPSSQQLIMDRSFAHCLRVQELNIVQNAAKPQLTTAPSTYCKHTAGSPEVISP